MTIMEGNKNPFETERPEMSEAEKLAQEIVGGASAPAQETSADLPDADGFAADPAFGEPPADADEENTRKKSLPWLWIVIAAVVVAGVAALLLLLPKAPEPKEEPTKPTAAPTTTAPTTKPIVRVENPIDFAELKKQNDDIVAWISVPNTNVDYPVAQSAEDEEEDFYLHHNLDKDYEFAGTVYIQKLNNKDFTDPHTVLYGHAMLNGTMFKTLHYFKEKEFFDENSEFTVYLPEHILTYKIFAAYQYDDRHLLYAFDTKNKDEFAKYLEIAQHPTASMQNTRALPLSTDSRIVTLSTCLKADAPIRYLVQGVLVKDELTYPPAERRSESQLADPE
ncbi:MAG: class B sortase [Clostridia bacterium]|nr:class B sortase [Clostridia bacterium]